MAELAPNTGGPQAVLDDALAAAAFEPGERVELLRLVRARPDTAPVPQHWIGTDRAAAASWVESNPTDVYLCLNPILEGAKPPKGAARAEDVARVRLLYVDADPTVAGDEGRADAQALAREVALWAAMRWRCTPALVDTGRGAGCWLRHEAVDVEGAAEVRRLVAEGLAARFRRAGARLDPSPHKANSHARLVGSFNGRTGELVRVLEPGDGAAIPWRDLVAFAAEARAELPPPKVGAWRVPPELRQALGEMPGREDAWSWLGSAAGRAGVHDRVAELVPEGFRHSFDRGARDPNRKWARPELQDVAKRVESGLERVATSAARASRAARTEQEISVTGITRRSEGAGRGGCVDLELQVAGVRYRMRGLDGRTLASYGLVRQRALLEGALLPPLGKEAQDVWHKILSKGWNEARIVEEREGSTHAAIVDAVQTALRNRTVGRTAGDLHQGRIVEVEGRIAVTGTAIVRTVRTLLDGDVISREAIAEAARELGADLSAEVPLPADGARVVRRRVWSFPASAREDA